MAKIKQNLFGNHIVPDCRYCSHNQTPEQTPTCTLHKTMHDDGRCEQFSYDPLLRKPQNLPALQRFDADDFKL